MSADWDSHEIHKAFASHPSFPAINEAFKPSLGGNVVIYDVSFSAPTVALEKPVTEILVLSLKAPENREAVVDILTKFSEASGKMLVFGQTRQDENKYVVLGGWPTVEVCRKDHEGENDHKIRDFFLIGTLGDCDEAGSFCST